MTDSEKSVVVLVPCREYDPELVYSAVSTGLSLLGGLPALISPEEKILLKPNLLCNAVAEKAVTTHPVVFDAVARCLQEQGYRNLSYGDSPGSPASTPEKAAEACGIAAKARGRGITPADFSTVVPTQLPEGEACKHFMLAKAVTECDALVNLCKMKTHALERITGAVKNLYGCICGTNKAAGHVRYPNSYAFADMLSDLHKAVKPRLHIMDGIVAMEGNGPSSGIPTHMGVLLFSTDPVALDSVYCALIRLDSAEVPTCVSAEKAGLGTRDPERITVLTPTGPISMEEAAATYGKPDFDVYRGALQRNMLSRMALLMPFLQERPKVDTAKCVGCGLCQEACPVEGKAVHSGKGQKAKYDYKKCIRCFCCQEMCPVKAISVYRGPVTRLLTRK